ncbi:hypothetical protein [Paenibacillus protaetiae]|uniref:Uncharacterized protein n=1 Tax=Paenibacillus protaetiae TaxID=2509456 RepID=A0A4P6EXZ0_9BACL|nr:hypothetical protein [Paenibacillus protaetiae]QAY67686.1 hypothetical protein ET464_16160 [Paenibacillus protaetiae]
MGLFSKWTALRTEGGSRAELIDRLEAALKAQGLKVKITDEGNNLKRLHVLQKQEQQARELLEQFDKEH